ncbi:MAG: hypothetical protein ACLSHG_02715 [Oscillospiraceae bacterium]
MTIRRAERVAAATLYELAHNAVRGHCFISYRNLLAATSQLSGVPDELVAESVDTLVQSGELVRERVAGCDGCYPRVCTRRRPTRPSACLP